MKNIKKYGISHHIDDQMLGGARDSRQIITDLVERALLAIEEEAVKEGHEPDWQTIDLRIFRDTTAPVGGLVERDEFLTLRARLLSKAGEIE